MQCGNQFTDSSNANSEPHYPLLLLGAPEAVQSIGRLVSAGLERLVYTEKVGGSNPSAPTDQLRIGEGSNPPQSHKSQ
jgi:hypothetical protein